MYLCYPNLHILKFLKNVHYFHNKKDLRKFLRSNFYYVVSQSTKLY